MMTPVQEVLNIHYSFYGAKAALARINSLLELNQEPQYPHHKNPFEHKTTVGISLRDIHFAYQPEQEILKGVDLDIQPGEKIALVGASGGGKSTMVQVLLGLYNPQQGEVLFDGIPVQEIGLDVVREHCATVLQHPALFNDTVRMNLTLGRDYEEDELNQALEIAQLREVIDELPDGLETLIGRQGVRLSGGQRQRLAIARMVLTRPSVVILDEATSALDSATEARVHEALSDFLRGRTTLIIAHRLSAVKQADRAYVFDDGRIIEEGTHDELIQGEGLYQKLYGHHQ
jgi:ATP-binding cassette subfamily C protein